MKRSAAYIFIDICILLAASVIALWLKPTAIIIYMKQYFQPFLLFIGIWLLISTLYKKYAKLSEQSYQDIFKNIITSNFMFLGVAALLMYLTRDTYFSRLIFFSTVGLATLFELTVWSALYFLVVTKSRDIPEDSFHTLHTAKTKRSKKHITGVTKDEFSYALINMKNAIVKEASENVYQLLSKHIDELNPKTLVLSTTTLSNIEYQPDQFFQQIINLKRINDIRFINKFFEAVNTKIPQNGIFISCVETKELRKRRIFKKYPPIINSFYYTFDFILKRVFPKFPYTKQIYFFLTRGENRVISKAETFGRLYSCGFELIDDIHINGLLYIVARKIKKPAYDMKPTYGPFITLRRLGKNGKAIKVYKLRTMHPYAEYLQDYIYQRYNLTEGGKFKNDFRVTSAGRIFRKFWIDELPMVFNLLKGDIKIVGVRPLSQHYFSLYTPELQEKRLKHKPGFIPPFYVDLPKTLEEIMASEMKYLNAYEKHPFSTDIKYFFAAFKNVLFKKARSK